jgi:predicted component of type VI protein secretion system
MSTTEAYLTDLQGQVVATITPPELLTFGRDKNNRIVLDDFSISSQHGAIAFRGGTFIIERWSRGRIWINSHNHPVEGSRMLEDHDRLLIGKRHVFVFRLGQPKAASLQPSPPEITPTRADDAAADKLPQEADEVPRTPEAARETLIEPEVQPEAEGAAEPAGTELGSSFTPAWAREPAARSAPPAPKPADAVETPDAEVVATVAEAPTPAPPPTPIPDWVKEETTGQDTERTPPEGVNILPGGWQRELQAAPPSPPPAVEDDVWGVRERSEARRLIQEAIQVLRQGDAERARNKLNQALRLNESNEEAWLWLAAAESDPDRRRGALQRVLTLNPNNVTAEWGLLSMQRGVAPPRLGFQATPPAYATTARPAAQPAPMIGESIPALLRPEAPSTGRGRTIVARLLGTLSVAMMGVALLLQYGVWQLPWQLPGSMAREITPADQLLTGLQIWGFVGIGVILVTALLTLLIRASGGRSLGTLLTIMGLAIIFTAVFPTLFGIVTEPQIGTIIWGAAGLPLMLAGLLKIW